MALNLSKEGNAVTNTSGGLVKVPADNKTSLNENMVEEEDEDDDIPEEIEDIIEHMLNGLRDKVFVI